MLIYAGRRASVCYIYLITHLDLWWGSKPASVPDSYQHTKSLVVVDMYAGCTWACMYTQLVGQAMTCVSQLYIVIHSVSSAHIRR
jgi:hypothetical protein